MLRLKEKAEDMVCERVALRRVQEEHKSNTKRLFGKFKPSKAVDVSMDAKHCNLNACENMHARDFYSCR